MKRVMSLFVVLLFVAGCTPDSNEIINDLVREFRNGFALDEEGEYDCPSGNASLPSGSHPDWAITPEGYHLDCGRRGKTRLLPGGVYTALTGSETHNDYVEYWEQCRTGTQPPNIQGRWVIYEDVALCLWEDIIPSVFACSEDIELHENSLGQVVGFTVDGDVIIYDEDNDQIATSSDYVVCRLTED